jgi:hypothetical protein
MLLKPFRSTTHFVALAGAGTYTPYANNVEGLFKVNTTIHSTTGTDQLVVQTWDGAVWTTIAYSNGQAINFYRNINFEFIGMGVRIVISGVANGSYSVARIK